MLSTFKLKFDFPSKALNQKCEEDSLYDLYHTLLKLQTVWKFLIRLLERFLGYEQFFLINAVKPKGHSWTFKASVRKVIFIFPKPFGFKWNNQIQEASVKEYEHF